jgi:type II secretory pathway pseudopilin PulG
MKISKNTAGFGIVEILLSVLIISLIIAITILFIPAKPDDKQQMKDIETISTAVRNYTTNNKGNLPSTITDFPTEICKTDAHDCTGFVNLSVLTVDEKYLRAIPVNLNAESTNGTGYAIKKTGDREVVVTALSGI